MAKSVEAVRSALAAFWGTDYDPVDRLEVIVFADRQSLADYTGHATGGYVVEGPSGPLLVMSLNGTGGRAVASHELAHHLIAQALHRQPRWLGEGLATYLETAEIDRTGTTVTFGKPPASVSPNDLIQQPLTIAQLWAWGSVDLTPLAAQPYYSNAWWLVHHLLDARGAQLNTFLTLLNGGGDPKAAWAQAFPGLTDVELTAELSASLARHELLNYSRPMQLRVIEPTATPITWAQLYALKAMLLTRTTVPLQRDEWQRRIEDQLESALVLDERNELALLLKAALIAGEKQRSEFLKGAATLLPESGRVHGELANSLGRLGRDPWPAFQQALQLSPDDPVVLAQAAQQVLLAGDHEKGLELAQRAVELRPYSSAVVDTYAAALASVGRCAEAVDRAKQAIDLIGHVSRVRSQYAARLHRYETDCSPQRPVQPVRELGSL